MVRYVQIMLQLWKVKEGTYDISGSDISGIINGEAIAGSKKMGVKTKNKSPLTTPTFLAALSSRTQ